jgi:hypothetical protein
LALAVLLPCAVHADDQVWVTATSDEHPVGSRHLFVKGEGETFDLSELSDGETRVFGSGDSQVTAYRDGDRVTLERGASAGEQALEMSCTIGVDTCQVVTFEDDPQRVAIVLRSESRCRAGDDDCDVGNVLAELGEGHSVMVRTLVTCDGEGECAENTVHAGGEPTMIRVETVAEGAAGSDLVVIGEGGSWVGDDARANVIMLGGDDSVTLRCPEGDATIRVDAEEADDVFLCPKHSKPMTKVDRPVIQMHRFEIDDAGDETREY